MSRRDVKPAEIAEALSRVSLPAGVTIRGWRESDFPEIQRLSSSEGWPTPSQRPTEALHAWHQSWPTLVATKAKRVIGFVRALSDEEVTTYIAEILVDAAWRGRGIGRALLDACHYLHPHTRHDLLATETSEGFYEGAGFQRFAGFRRNYAD